MNVIASPTFETQLRAVLSAFDHENAKAFKLYLDTVLVNLPTKAHKYKRSIYCDDDRVRDVEHQGCTIPFFEDKANATFVLLGIIQHTHVS